MDKRIADLKQAAEIQEMMENFTISDALRKALVLRTAQELMQEEERTRSVNQTSQFVNMRNYNRSSR